RRNTCGPPLMASRSVEKFLLTCVASAAVPLENTNGSTTAHAVRGKPATKTRATTVAVNRDRPRCFRKCAPTNPTATDRRRTAPKLVAGAAAMPLQTIVPHGCPHMAVSFCSAKRRRAAGDGLLSELQGTHQRRSEVRRSPWGSLPAYLAGETTNRRRSDDEGS